MKKLTLFLIVLAALLLVVPTIGAQGGLSNYDSGFQVQNLSGTDTANIVVTYYNQDGSVDATVNDTIAPSSSNTYFPIGASSGFNGSVVISSDQPVAAIVNVLSNNFAYSASYDSFSGGSDSVALPLIMKGNAGFSTWFNVQNTGSSDVTVDVAYGGTACTESDTIAPGAAATFDQTTNSCLTSGYVGSATVTAGAGGSVVATVMEVGPTTLFAYNGFTSTSTNPVIPLVNANNVSYVTGIQIQNAGSNDTDVTINYTPVTGLGTACSETKSITAGTSATFALFAFSLSGDPDPGVDDCVFGATFVGSATVSQTGSEPLAGIVNQLSFSANKGSSYNAFDPASATDTVVMPLIMDRNFGFYTGFNLQVISGADTTVSCNYVGEDGGGNPINQLVNVTVTDGVANQVHLPGLNPIAPGFVGAGTCTGSEPLLAVVNEVGSSSGDVLFSYEGFNN